MLNFPFSDLPSRLATMCNYGGVLPYWAYPLYQYPTTYASYPGYGIPLGYAYAPPVDSAFAAPPAYFFGAAGLPRGEHKVGNCLIICQ